MAVTHKLPAFPLFAKTEILDEAHDRNGERVIGHQDINLCGGHTGLAKGHRGGLGPRADRNIATVFPVLGRLASANNPHWLLAAVARHSRRRDDHRSTTIRDHTALE